MGAHLRDRDGPQGGRHAAWGFLGGAIGFPLGQCFQAFHAWNPALFQTGLGFRLEPVMNRWNWMETIFGMTRGGALALGLHRNRHRIRFPWPWIPWTARTPNALFFLLAAGVIAWIGLQAGRCRPAVTGGVESPRRDASPTA
jgi:hypothetical protein